jgi:hypothetical protein
LGDGAKALETTHFSVNAKAMRYFQDKVSNPHNEDNLFIGIQHDISAVKVVPNDNAPELVSAPSRIKKEEIHLNDLPSALHNIFRSMVPHLREFAGMVCLWQNLRDQDVRAAWDLCTSVVTPDIDDRTFFALVKLVYPFLCVGS